MTLAGSSQPIRCHNTLFNSDIRETVSRYLIVGGGGAVGTTAPEAAMQFVGNYPVSIIQYDASEPKMLSFMALLRERGT